MNENFSAEELGTTSLKQFVASHSIAITVAIFLFAAIGIALAL